MYSVMFSVCLCYNLNLFYTILVYTKENTKQNSQANTTQLLPSSVNSILRHRRPLREILVRAVDGRLQTLARPAARRRMVGQAHAIGRTAAVGHLTGAVEQRTVVGDGRQAVHAMVAEERYLGGGQSVRVVVDGLDALAAWGNADGDFVNGN